MSRLRRHLTYANVMATLAVFLVLGGGSALGAYVISSNDQVGPGTISGHKPPPGDRVNIIRGSINTGDLAPRSVGNSKLTPNAVGTQNFAPGAVAPRAAVSSRTAQLVVATSHRRRAKRAASAAADTAGGSLVTMSLGESRTLVDKPPFKVTASCIDEGDGAYRVQTYATSSENGWMDNTEGPYAADRVVKLGGWSSKSPAFVLFAFGALMAPSGAALTMSNVNLGVHLFSDCALTMYAVG